jgi:hypothetical protein
MQFAQVLAVRHEIHWTSVNPFDGFHGVDHIQNGQRVRRMGQFDSPANASLQVDDLFALEPLQDFRQVCQRDFGRLSD